MTEYVLAGYWAVGYVESGGAVSTPNQGAWVWAMPYQDDEKRAAKDARYRDRNRQQWADVERALYDAVREVKISPAVAVAAVAVPAKVRAAAMRMMPDFGDTGRAMGRIGDLMDAIWRDSIDRARRDAKTMARAMRDEEDFLILVMA